VDNRRLFLAALLSLAVLFLWQWIFPPEKPQPPQPVEESAVGLVADATEGEVIRGVSDEVAPLASDGDATAAAVSGLDAADQPTPEAVVIRAEIEEEIVLETKDAIARFTNRGAQLVSYELKEHPDSEGGRVDLVRRRQEGPYPFGLVGADGEPHSLNRALFVVDRSESAGVSFEYSGPEGAGRKEFDLSESGLMEVLIEAGGEAFGVVLGPGVRNPSEAEQENRFSTKTAIYKRAGEVELLAAAAVKERTIVSGDAVEWVGLQDNYFLSGWVTGSPLAEIIVQPYLELPGSDGSRFHPLLPGQELTGEEKDLPRELTCTIQPRGLVLEGSVYFGAKQYDRLKALADPRTGQPYGLEEAVALGFFGFFSKILLVGLQWIHGNIVGNYGWAIILLTVLIRIILFPLTHKSFASMQKMQELNPKIQAIRQKYRSKLKDKQGRPNAEAQRKMNEEVMGLYKKEGVNPAGGCLPMLIQMPVLFAFYRLLSAAVELRHAPWLGWIQDLSAPDPFYILPLVMGASQFIQQKMTPSTADPMQRRIFMLMPVFFTVLFLGFPSGLVLYWLTNNVLGIAQQGAYRRIRQRAAEAK
jgi:YidC/Oxa1 family membrane protein insertase